MRNRFSSQLKKFFSLTKSEQRGVVVFLSILFILLSINFSLPLFIHKKTYNYVRFQSEIDRFLAKKQNIEDSLHIENLQNEGALDYELAKQKLKPFLFNPNQLPEEEWLKMGLTKRQVRCIMNYEAHGGKFFRKEDLKKIYLLSKVEYNILAPYIKIPDEFITMGEKPTSRRKFFAHKTSLPLKLQQIEINRCDSVALITHLGLSSWIASRIIKYRRLLGGFYRKNQLLEVYGLKKNLFVKIRRYLLIDTTTLHKIDVNNAGFKEIMRHPYLNYSDTKKLIKGRKKRGGYRSFKAIEEDLQLSDSTLNKIKHYLYLRPFKNYNDE